MNFDRLVEGIIMDACPVYRYYELASNYINLESIFNITCTVIRSLSCDDMRDVNLNMALTTNTFQGL